jgi:Ca-activated chloride channel family protein
LRGAALAVLVVALAGPRWPDLRTRVHTESVAIVVLLDVSKTMENRDFAWQGGAVRRLDAAKHVLGLFVVGGTGEDGHAFEGRPHDLIGLVAFAARPQVACPLTLSHSVLVRTLEEQQARTVPGEAATNISDAIAIGLHRLRQAAPQRKVLVLLSDGEQSVPAPRSGWTPRQAAQVAASLGVPIYAVDAGGELAPTSDPRYLEAAAAREAGRKTMQDVAEITSGAGGRYFEAGDGQALLEIGRAIDRLERQPVESFQYRRYHEGYPWFGLASLVLLMTAVVFDLTVWRRLP